VSGIMGVGQWWLSFVDEDEWLGGAVVDALSFLDAVGVAHRLGCNPGGQVAGWPVVGIPDEYTGRLLTREEVSALHDSP
jgi:hypothetical protein